MTPTPSTRINRPLICFEPPMSSPAIPRYWSIVGFHCTAGHGFCRSAVSPSELKSNHTTDAGWSKNWMNMDEYDKHTRQFPDFATRNLFVIEIEVVLESFFSFHKPSNLSMKCLEMPWKHRVHALVQAAAKRVSLFLFPPTSLGRVRPWGSRWVSAL